MSSEYQVRLTAKNEGIEYRDEYGIYRFNAALEGSQWTLFLPGSKGDKYDIYKLSKEEENRILPRIILYLQKLKWLGLFGKNYSVIIKRN